MGKEQRVVCSGGLVPDGFFFENIFVYSSIHTSSHMPIDMCVHMSIHTATSMSINIANPYDFARVDMHVYTHAVDFVSTLVCAHVYMHAYMNA